MELIDAHIRKGAFTIAPIGDIQYGSQGCSTSLLEKDIERITALGQFAIGMGDYTDPMSPSNRAALKVARASLYESTNDLIDGAVEDMVRELATKYLKRVPKKNWLGLVHGDHGWDFQDGQPSDAMLARILGAPYLGDSAIISIHQAGIRPLKVLVTHGRGSSVSSTGKTLHLERMLAAFDVDVVLMGHSHLKYGVPIEKIGTRETKRGSRLYAESKVVAITGSYLKGYQAHTSKAGWPGGSYVEQAAMRPVPLGGIQVHAYPVKEEWGMEWELTVTA